MDVLSSTKEGSTFENRQLFNNSVIFEEMGHLVGEAEVQNIEQHIQHKNQTKAVGINTPAETVNTLKPREIQQQQQQQHQQSQERQQQQQQIQVQKQQQEGKDKQHDIQVLQSCCQTTHQTVTQIAEDVYVVECSSPSEEEVNVWWVERIVRAMQSVGGYRETWYRAQVHLLYGDGPLPITWRLYIAIMAVCRHEVPSLVETLLLEFQNGGGDVQWIGGIHKVPPKLASLSRINNILAHQPWLLKPQHIQELTTGEESWSLAELCQALCLLTHFHSLVSFIHTSGCAKPTDKNRGVTNESTNIVSKKSETPSLQTGGKSPEKVQASMSNTATQKSQQSDCDKISSKSFIPLRQYRHLTVDPDFTYQDFSNVPDISIPSFPIQDYSWQDHGFALCSRLLGDTGVLLDERFTAVFARQNLRLFELQLATHSMGFAHSEPKKREKAEVSRLPEQYITKQTSPTTKLLPSKALWKHVQWLLGIRYDDFDYGELNINLGPGMREFTKIACCFPDKSKGTPLSHADMIQASVLVMEARFQSELLYALRAIMVVTQC